MKPILRRYAILAHGLLAAACAAPGAATTDRRRPDLTGLDEVVRSAMATMEIPGLALAVVDEEGVIVAKGYGVRELGSPTPVDADTLFDIGSITKTFTATAVALLVDERRLTWSARIRDLVPGFSLEDEYLARELTVADVASHRTGFTDNYFYDLRPDMDRAEFLARLHHSQLEQPFRTAFVYHNAFFGLCDPVIESTSGTPWADFVTDRIFAPLGMDATRATSAAAQEVRNRARPHALTAHGMSPVSQRDREPVPSAGAIRSSANDMARWCRFQLRATDPDGALHLAPETLHEMRTLHVSGTFDWFAEWGYGRQRAGYGLGWMLTDYRDDADQHVGHGGAVQGMQAWMVVSPRHRYGVVLMTNGGWAGDRVHFAIANWIHDRWLGLTPVDWVGQHLTAFRARYDKFLAEQDAERHGATRPPDLPLEAYAGTYQHPMYGPMVVRRVGDALDVSLGVLHTMASPRGGHAFYLDWDVLDAPNGTVVFAVRDAVVTGLTYDDGLRFEFTR